MSISRGVIDAAYLKRTSDNPPIGSKLVVIAVASKNGHGAALCGYGFCRRMLAGLVYVGEAGGMRDILIGQAEDAPQVPP